MFNVETIYACDNVDRKTRLHDEVMGQTERVLIHNILRHTYGNQSKAANILGITRGSLRTKMQKYGIAVTGIVVCCKPEMV